ncbi:bifunctional hydroxymethylpyrimidine kinase/phosphomethylpyrimidine kinase [Parapedomonas caeni]|jgi:hydroxymethylpyrimidine/phosphomethylpyrimidine kinase
MNGRVLIAAGSDSGGGAGIQADIKTVTALGGYAMTAITALTAQNTLGVHGVWPVSPEFIARQLVVVLDDIGADAIKTGMLHDAAVTRTVADVLAEKASAVPLVVDPVMVAKGGAPLLEAEAVGALWARLIPAATLITPNIPEAELLAGQPIATTDDVLAAGRLLLARGARAVLMKGGHRAGDEVEDWLLTPTGARRFTSPRIDSKDTHGTGCTLASAIATGLAQGMTLPMAVDRARHYVLEAIRQAPGLGQGHGPLNHGWPCALPSADR